MRSRRVLPRIEQRTADFKYVGVFVDRPGYQPGNFITHDGSTWICKAPTSSRPGVDTA